jgi:hypothetical protein
MWHGDSLEFGAATRSPLRSAGCCLIRPAERLFRLTVFHWLLRWLYPHSQVLK